jgi:CubicO group peptidase (beta-lactamase class C family)
VFSDGYNLSMTPRELARFGLLFLHDGDRDGHQLVPASWVQQSIQPQPPAEDGYDDGYYWWLLSGGTQDIAIAWGFGGQFVYLVPALDLMVVMTADTATDHAELEGERLLFAICLRRCSSRSALATCAVASSLALGVVAGRGAIALTWLASPARARSW